MNEIQALGVIVEALDGVEEQDAIDRILDYVLARFGGDQERQRKNTGKTESRTDSADEESGGQLHGNELPGIALLTDSGDFKLTVRDPKAKNTNDAAVRLALVAIHTYCQLSREKTASSKRIVKPILENWRAYTGNTRRALAQHPGILRDGDALSLDHHATVEAENIIHDIKDPSVEGTWKPTNGQRTRKSTAKAGAAKSTEE